MIFLLLGIVICLGSLRLPRSWKAIDAGQYEPLRDAVTALTVVVVLGSLAITGLVLGSSSIWDKVSDARDKPVSGTNGTRISLKPLASSASAACGEVP